MLHRTFLLTLGLFALASTINAQKMNILDYFKEFMSNQASPNNQMAEMNAQLSQVDGEYLVHYFEDDEYPAKLEIKGNLLTFKKGHGEGWNNSQCFPTFKLFTQADGKQILAVTEDSYRHHGYRSKYQPQDETQADWNQRPKPIKFWSYEDGEWSDITDEVIAEEVWLTLKEMIISTTDLVKAEDVDYMLEKYILHQDGMYPLYRLDPNTNDITVWVDHNHLKKITYKGYEEGDDVGTNEDGMMNYEQAMAGQLGEDVGRLVDFIYESKFRTYTLVFDAKTGKFTRKK